MRMVHPRSPTEGSSLPFMYGKCYTESIFLNHCKIPVQHCFCTREQTNSFLVPYFTFTAQVWNTGMNLFHTDRINTRGPSDQYLLNGFLRLNLHSTSQLQVFSPSSILDPRTVHDGTEFNVLLMSLCPVSGSSPKYVYSCYHCRLSRLPSAKLGPPPPQVPSMGILG